MTSGTVASEREPERSRLGQILAERPEARPQFQDAVAGLLATALATIAVLGLLLIWHLRRRARLIRQRLAHLHDIRLPGPFKAPYRELRQLAGRDDVAAT
ncbi:MAG: hypothetical protein JO161_09280 [Planctomycetaceae bacterium]|nr:hypothetical protein [Planctomycetaceae bacterium]